MVNCLSLSATGSAAKIYNGRDYSNLVQNWRAKTASNAGVYNHRIPTSRCPYTPRKISNLKDAAETHSVSILYM